MHINTKYSIGDKVWYDDPQEVAKKHPCPDCLGQKKWKVTSPAGSEYEFRCPRCSVRFIGNDKHNLNYTAYEPASKLLTIGSVRFDTQDGEQYMCEETGVGGGQIYPASRLHSSKEDALIASKLICDHRNNDPNSHVLPRYQHTLELSDFELHRVPK